MKSFAHVAPFAAALVCGSVFLTSLWSQNYGTKVNQAVWAPKPTPAALEPWKAPMKPLTKLSNIQADHEGLKNWKVTVVDDEFLHADYIQMAPGEKTLRRAHPDTREWWVIQDGAIRFTIDGVEPFVATKGYLVQVPYRTFYTMETVGDKPSLRFEVNIARARLMYPADVKPPVVDGINWIKATIPSRGAWDQGNRPYLDFNKVADGTEKQNRFIADDRAVANIILGEAGKLPPAKDSDKGHFHAECAEFWIILKGQMNYRIEGAPEIVADQGDVVYTPRGHWHRARFHGPGQSCRLAMNGFQDIGHYFEAE
jgi:mannose-6-phosphate isomerase-like protein (cupin superfamily)